MHYSLESDGNETFIRHLSDRFATIRDLLETTRDGWKKNHKRRAGTAGSLEKEGLTAREIAQRLDRSPAAIRNLRYKKHLVAKVEDETKALFQQRDELINVVKSLQGQKTSLAFEVEYLRKEKGRPGAAIAIDRARLEETLAQAMMNLKIQRPDLFTLSDPEQIAMLLKVILK